MNIKNTAPLLADFFVDTKWDYKHYEEYQIWLKQKSALLGPLYKYIIGSLHDSKILSIDFSDDDLTLSLNHSCTCLFANVFCHRNALDIKSEKLIFPIEICFQNAKFHYYKIAKNGQMKSVKPVKSNEYMGEQILYATDNGISLGIVIWRDNPRGYFYIGIHAKEIVITEVQKSAWRTIFGDKNMDVYYYFQEQFNTYRFLNDQNECEIVYDEFFR